VFDLPGGQLTGFSDITGDSDLVSLPSTGTYTLTAHGTGGQYSGSYAFRLVETTQTDLTLAQLTAARLPAAGKPNCSG